MKKINVIVLCTLFIIWMVSCATTQVKEVSTGDSAEFTQEEADTQRVMESFADSPGQGKNDLQLDVASSIPTSDAFRTNYFQFGPDSVPFIVSIPNNTEQEIIAVVWLCDSSTLNTSIFDLRTYPDTYKEKYMIALTPYEFESGNIRVRDIKDSVGDIVDFVKDIAGKNHINLSRIILVGYTPGRFSMAYL
jgi:hypothetical protein